MTGILEEFAELTPGWDQLVLAFGVYVVSDRERKTRWERDKRRAAGVRPDEVVRAERRHATDADRLAAIRESKKRYQARRRAALKAAAA